MLVYLDPSSIDAAIRAGKSPEAFLELLAAHGYTPVASHMVLHELARPLVFGKQAIAVEQLRFLRALRPSWHVSAIDLFRREVAFFRTHETISPNLDAITLTDTLEELDGLCAGHIRATLRTAIKEHCEAKATFWPKSINDYIDTSKRLRRSDPTEAPNFKTLGEMKAYFTPNLHLFLATVPSVRLTRQEAHTLARQLDNYPAIQANVNYWFYLQFIAHKNQVVPAHDRLDDCRHASEATYCRALISNDKGLLRALPDIAPRVRPLSWLDVAAAA